VTIKKNNNKGKRENYRFKYSLSLFLFLSGVLADSLEFPLAKKVQEYHIPFHTGKKTRRKGNIQEEPTLGWPALLVLILGGLTVTCCQ
jgi:hypothetical protein